MGQLLKLISVHVFDHHSLDDHGPKPRKISSWTLWVAMLFGQLSTWEILRHLKFISLTKAQTISPGPLDGEALPSKVGRGLVELASLPQTML
jgi:hypothetical protein